MADRTQYVQARRIRCGLCDQPFIYVHGWVTGSPLPEWVLTLGGALSPLVPFLGAGLAQLNKRDFKSEEADLPGLAHMEFAGEALCPHCRCWQLWMFATAGAARSRPLLYASPFLAMIPVMVLSLMFPRFENLGGATWVALTVILMIVVARRASRPRSSPVLVDGQDPRAFADEEFDEWVVACRRENADPVRKWARLCGLAKPAHTSVQSLGLLDLIGENRHPHLATERKLAARRGNRG